MLVTNLKVLIKDKISKKHPITRYIDLTYLKLK